jgi:hypothetical protein
MKSVATPGENTKPGKHFADIPEAVRTSSHTQSEHRLNRAAILGLIDATAQSALSRQSILARPEKDCEVPRLEGCTEEHI